MVGWLRERQLPQGGFAFHDEQTAVIGYNGPACPNDTVHILPYQQVELIGGSEVVVTSLPFRFHGRRSRLVKVNGQRVHLDHVEERLRELVPCADLACVPIPDEVRGEDFDLLVVEDPRYPLGTDAVRRRIRDALPRPGPSGMATRSALPPLDRLAITSPSRG